MELNAWTKVGDVFEATGRWTIYTFKARILSVVEPVADWPSDETAVASRAYAARAQKLHRGGLWLVAPDGKVVATLWVPVRVIG